MIFFGKNWKKDYGSPLGYGYGSPLGYGNRSISMDYNNPIFWGYGSLFDPLQGFSPKFEEKMFENCFILCIPTKFCKFFFFCGQKKFYSR